MSDIRAERNKHVVELTDGKIKKAKVAISKILWEKYKAMLDDNSLTIDGNRVWLSWYLKKTLEPGWYGGYTGKIRASVGGYGNRKSYPEKKDGTLSYDKIADSIYELYRSKVAKAEYESKRRSKIGVYNKAREDIYDELGYGYSAMTAGENGIKVSLYDLDEAATKKILELAKELGAL